MLNRLTLALLSAAAIASPAQASQCQVTNLSYDFDAERSNQFNGMLVLHVGTTPRREQRSISGRLMVYFHYRDFSGVERKGSAFASFMDSAPEGEGTTDIDVNFSVFGEALDVYDIKMNEFDCSTD